MAQKTVAYRPTPTNPTTTVPASSESTVTAGTDELLDEIDSVLEGNVLEVLRTFVNRGGE